jgi:ornithine cyclodeaminase/alanine dehydrogenase-like protein (mu-crystallin family)
LLRGNEIKHLSIINRSFESAGRLIQRLYSSEEEDGETREPNGRNSTPTAPLPRPKIQILTPSANEYERLLKSTIRSSSVIFCTTPSLTPLFPAPYLTNPEGRKKGRYVAAIGSYKPHMLELAPEILKQNVAPDHHRHHHKHARQGGAVIVDSVDACLKEAGEIIQAGLSAGEVVEIGELIMLKKDAERRREEAKARGQHMHDEVHGLDTGGVELAEAKKNKWWTTGGGHKKKHADKNKGMEHEFEVEDKTHSSLLEWLQKGNVIYKSVGLGLMDVVVGGDLVRLADERGIGTRIHNF